MHQPVIAAAVYVASDMPAPEYVRHSGRGELVIGADRGGARAAVFYTMIETSKLKGLDPEGYIAAVVDRMAKGHNSKAPDTPLPWKFRLPRAILT